MSVNGKTCWRKSKISQATGSDQCGHGGNYKEERYPVACKATLSGVGDRPLTLRVWTSLDQGSQDESFGIDNVVIRTQELQFPIIEQFSDASDFEGWNCGKIQKCGTFGNICGGAGVKGKGSDIKKTFQLPEGKYLINLKFLQIDSWYV